MPDLNVMMREHALSGLQTQLDTAVTNGDTEAARKIADDLAALKLSTAPKAPPYNDTDIRAELDKLAWFGTDPKKSARAVELGKSLDPKKFATAVDFAAALVKVVDEEFKPAGTGKDDEGEGDEDDEGEGDEDEKPAKKPRRTDGPGEGDQTNRSRRTLSATPWAKLSDAPADVQKEINRTADKFAPKTKEGREGYVTKALQAHHAAVQRAKTAGKR